MLTPVVLQNHLNLTCCVVGEQSTRMVVADCRREVGMLIVCDEIETLLNELAAIIVKRLQENAKAKPSLSENDIMKQLAAQQEVFYCIVSYTYISIQTSVNEIKYFVLLL